MVGGHTYKATLDADGKATVTLRTFTHPGTFTAEVKYQGDDRTRSSETTLTLHVVKKNKR